MNKSEKVIARVELYKFKTISQALDKAKADYEEARAFLIKQDMTVITTK